MPHCWKLRQLVLLKLKACAQYNVKSTWFLHSSHAGHVIASWEGRWGPWPWSSELPAPPIPAPGVSVKSQGIKSNAFIQVSCTAGRSFTIWASREDLSKHRTQKHIRSTTFKVLILEFGKMPLSKLERTPFQGQHDGMWIVLPCRWPKKHSTLIKKKKKFTCVCCRLLGCKTRREPTADTEVDRPKRDHHVDWSALSLFSFVWSLIIIRHVLPFLEIWITESFTFEHIDSNCRDC